MKPTHRTENIVIQQTKLETIVYDLNIDKAFLLNETSAFIWQMCDGKTEVTAITQALSKKFKQPANDDFVWLAIDGLKNEGLVTDDEDVEIKFDGLSRREIIRKVGLASMIALPVVLSLTAPKAANAQSTTCNWALGCKATGALMCPTGCFRQTYTYRLCGSNDGTCRNCGGNGIQTCPNPFNLSLGDMLIVSIP